jgi:hypothetical protein
LARSPQLGGATFDSFAIVVWVLPDLTDERELPPGVPVTDWEEFQARFAVHRRGTYGCQAAFGRSWNSAPRLEGCARYSFGVVLVRQDRHLKISIFSDQWTKSFEVDGVGAPARALSDSVRAELLFESESPARPSKLTGWRYGQVDKLPVRVAMAKARTWPLRGPIRAG